MADHDPSSLERSLRAELDGLGLPVRPAVMPTGWPVGPVHAYLFEGDPLTLVDAGRDLPESRTAIEEALAASGRRPADVARVVCTHGDSDHLGCAAWLQERSGCDVLLHPLDIDRLAAFQRGPDELLLPLGFSAGDVERYFSGERPRWSLPRFTPIRDGQVVEAGAVRLRLEHHPGHSPGHVWAVEEGSGAIFVGDYLLASAPTSAGLEADPSQPSGRRPMLALYEQGLRELARRDAPALFPGHGPPVRRHAELIERRLHKSARRTDHVLEQLRASGAVTALGLARRMFGERLSANPWGFLADLVGRLDVLVADGRAEARKGDDGVWWFETR